MKYSPLTIIKRLSNIGIERNAVRGMLCLLFILLSFGQLQRISFYNQQINGYLHELFMVLIIILWSISNIKTLLVRKKISTLSKSILIFISILLFSLIFNFWNFSIFQNLVGFAYLARLIVYLTFFLVIKDWSKKNNQKEINRSILIFTYITIFLSFVQYFFYPNLRNLYYLGWDPHHYRAFGTFLDTSIAGIIFVMLFIWNFRVKSKLRPLILLSLFILMVLSYSRITYISFFVGIAYFLKDKLTLKKALIFIFSFLIILMLLPQHMGESVNLKRVFTIESRIRDYKEGFKIFLKNPIVGVGYNRIRFVREKDKGEYANHEGANFSSSFLSILVSSGMIGLASLIFFLSLIFKEASHLGRTVMLTVLIASLFDNIILHNFILLIMLTMLI